MKIVKISTIIILIALISLISVFGIYTPIQNRMENQVIDYKYAMDLGESRMITLKVNEEVETFIKDSEGNLAISAEGLTDENGNILDEALYLTAEEVAAKGYVKEEVSINSEEIKIAENYTNSKEIVEKRLKELDVQNYILRVDEQTGTIVLEIEENENADFIAANIYNKGDFQIVDTQTQEVLMVNSDIKSVDILYGQSETGTGLVGTTVYLDIEFTDEGTEKFRNISETYVGTIPAASPDDEDIEKTITLKIDDVDIMETGFETPIENGKLQMSMGATATDDETLQSTIDQATIIAVMLNNGEIPLEYVLGENLLINSSITNQDKAIIGYSIIAILVIILVILTIKYKTNGLLMGISNVGFIALLSIILKYTNVVISLEGIVAVFIIIIINILFIKKLLNRVKIEDVKNATKETLKEMILILIPIIIMIIVLSFINWLPISSFGMVMVWGIMLLVVYNINISDMLLKINMEEK